MRVSAYHQSLQKNKCFNREDPVSVHNPFRKTQLVSIIGLLFVMTLFLGSEAFATYNRSAGIHYASTWCKARNSQAYEAYPSDCANFVSQCLIAGGLDLSNEAGRGTGKSSNCIIWTPSLHNYLVKISDRYEVRSRGDDAPPWFQPGDVAIFGSAQSSYSHVVFCVSSDNAYHARCAAHTKDTCSTTIRTFFALNTSWTKCTYYHVGRGGASSFSVTGRVVLNSAGLADVTVSLTGVASATTTTDSNGNYRFSSLTVGTYTVRPRKTGYSFRPQSKRIGISDSHVTGQDFSATTTGSLSPLPPTATVLVMDVSGSMGWRWKGGVKIESAKKAALEFIEQVTHEGQTRGGQHRIGVVAFSGGASVLLPLTSDYNRAKQVIISLSATSATNLGAGLVAGLGELNKTPSTTQRFIILLSDGETNTGLSPDQILNGPVVEARRKKICIHTVAFGDPGDIDANFLRKVGIGSGCGSYSHAETAFELFSTYLKLRHKSLGQVIGEYSSIGKRVTILPGVPISLGTVLIGSGKRELHYTLAWSEQGRLQIRLLTLLSPKSGAWTIEAAAATSMPNGTEYYAVLSTRPGGIAIPLPLPIFTVGDRTFGLPSGLPTWFLVSISIALIALVLYKEFIK